MRKPRETIASLLSKIKRLEKRVKELEKKVEHVLDEDVTEIPNNDKLNRPTQHPE